MTINAEIGQNAREMPVMLKRLDPLGTVLGVLLVALLALLPVGSSYAQEPVRIVVLGDSLVAGYGLGPGEAFPEQLQNRLEADGKSVEIINAGVSGDTTSGGLARLDWSVPDGTDGVILELGANDALRGISPSVSEKNLQAMIEQLKDRNIELLLVGMMAPPNMGKSYQEAFNPIFARLAQTHDIMLDPFFLEGVAADPALNQADGIHPTAAGIAKIVDRFLPLAKDFISRISNNG